ncbi:uncharacterized protein LOC134842566 [Symsagittifera roscoffensis]|uniref:uncharacterized protein LOC134842566 n=1 Tax=Symsagittifera roscoffensis TaxID=84072 RepID=UPI00307B38DA
MANLGSSSTGLMNQVSAKLGSGLGLLAMFLFIYLIYSFTLHSSVTIEQAARITPRVSGLDLSSDSMSTAAKLEQKSTDKSYMPKVHIKQNFSQLPSHLDHIKNMSTSDLAKMVLSNCRLTQNFEGEFKRPNGELDEPKLMKETEKIVAKVRIDKRYRWPPAYDSRDKKSYAYCLNTKSGSTFLQNYILRKGRRGATKVERVNAFMVIREPMHRMLSAYLNKLKECKNHKNTCAPWTSFAKNIAIYVQNIHKTKSNLYNKALTTLRSWDVEFDDFVDYIIHMYLRNDGKINNPEPDISTPSWTWWHWQSVVSERCYPCSAIWRDVVLFENLEGHLKQVLPKYPILFINEHALPEIKSSDTTAKLKLYFDMLDDSQLWFLGCVMYKLDYAILPYNFNAFLVSIGREHVSQMDKESNF